MLYAFKADRFTRIISTVVNTIFLLHTPYIFTAHASYTIFVLHTHYNTIFLLHTPYTFT